MLEQRLAGHRTAIVWPATPAEVPDHDPSFLVAYVPFQFGTKPGKTRESEAIEYMEKCGARRPAVDSRAGARSKTPSIGSSIPF
jgi:hypothetical protein